MKAVTVHLKLIFCSIIFTFLITSCLSARILGVVPTPSYSHQIVFHPIWKELSLRGHQVTVLTTDPMNNSSLVNLTEIDLHLSYEIWNEMNLVNIAKAGPLQLVNNMFELADRIVDQQLQHPDVVALIRNETEHFDLVIVERLFLAMVAFAERFACPMILISSMDALNYNYELIGNPAHPVLNPDFWLPFTGQLTFSERLISSLAGWFIKWYFDFLFMPQQQLLIEQHFGKGYSSLYEILSNTSLLFVNTDPIFHQIRPLVPSVIQIGGGTHLRSPQPLPKDLQKQLDNASQGFIYFSSGTNVKSRELSENSRQIILETFAELPYTVLWKFELEDLPRKPENVIISKWFPQDDILTTKHPNIKLFITQGGLQSIEESIYNHVPIVGMPFIVDQPNNVRKIVSRGLGLSVDYTTLDKENFKSTILEAINNPKFRNKVKELAELALDQPMTGFERAIWWTEYVLRHKGAQHLRSPAIDLPLYQYFLLDVIVVCLLVIVIAIILVVSLIRLMFKLLNRFKSKAKVKVQ